MHRLMSAMNESTTGIRWACRFSDWYPTEAEWSKACSFVQPEELDRIHRFVFKRDAKAALSGRLLMRKFLTWELQIPNDELILTRTDKGKPYLLEPQQGDHPWSFNLSHSGDFVMLGAEKDCLLGIDIMRTDYPKRKSLTDYFNLMRSQFTEREWKVIQSPFEDAEKLRNFYRLWCLKESYVKALGVGIAYSVSRLDFDISPVFNADAGRKSQISLAIDNMELPNWKFSEFVVDADHIGAVALQGPQEILSSRKEPILISVELSQLLAGINPLSKTNNEYGHEFMAKPEKPN